MSVKRVVSEKNRKFNSDWEERHFFTNNGKPVSCEVASNIHSERVFI